MYGEEICGCCCSGWLAAKEELVAARGRVVELPDAAANGTDEGRSEIRICFEEV